METGKELTGTGGQPYQQAHDAPLSVHFLAIDGIAGQEIDLVIAVLDDLVAEMRRLESATIQGTDSGRSYPPIQGG